MIRFIFYINMTTEKEMIGRPIPAPRPAWTLKPKNKDILLKSLHSKERIEYQEELSKKKKNSKNPHPPSSIESVLFEYNDPVRQEWRDVSGWSVIKDVSVVQTGDYVLKSGTYKAFNLDGTYIHRKTGVRTYGKDHSWVKESSPKKWVKWKYWNGKYWGQCQASKITT